MTNIVELSPTALTSRSYVVATDGACRGNPGQGGWGVVLHSLNGETLRSAKELSGAASSTTNNVMELTAAIEGLRWLNGHMNPTWRSAPVTVISDSRYVLQGMTEWVPKWQANGWRNASRKPVANQELWEALIAASAGLNIAWSWVKGHAGHPENERADMLANQAIDRLLSRKRA
jgi:ribonuclease HI